MNHGDIVFIGNSITEGDKDWEKKLGIRHLKNRGISGDVTDGVYGKEEGFDQAEALYNLNEDVSESNNIIKIHPDITIELKKEIELFETSLKKMHVQLELRTNTSIYTFTDNHLIIEYKEIYLIVLI